MRPTPTPTKPHTDTVTVPKSVLFDIAMMLQISTDIPQHSALKQLAEQLFTLAK